MSEKYNLLHELDAIEAFAFWLKHAMPIWSISKPTLAYIGLRASHPVFTLYLHGISMGEYQAPLEALVRIGDDKLTREYLTMVARANENDELDFQEPP